MIDYLYMEMNIFCNVFSAYWVSITLIAMCCCKSQFTRPGQLGMAEFQRFVNFIAIGRSTRDHTIDVDLSLEGPAAKVSRKQATVRLRNSGDFFMSSEGKRPIFVDGRPVLQGNKVKLNHNSVIEIAGLRFVFLINQDLISAIRQEAVKVTIPV